MASTKPAVLFLCTHNAGRSQMAMGFFKHFAGTRADVYSGGSEPADELHPAVIAVMAEKAIDIATEQPKRWTMDMLEAADVVITMGCGDSCPVLPGRRYEDWVLADPAGEDQHVEAAHGGRHGGDRRAEPVQVDVPAEHGPLVARGGAAEYFAHVARAGQAGQAGAGFQSGRELARRHVRMLLQPQHQSGVHRA